MRKINFSDTHIKNMFIFLNRVTLTGEEVPAFNGVVQALNNPVVDVPFENQLNSLPDEFFKKVLAARGYSVNIEKINTAPNLEDGDIKEDIGKNEEKLDENINSESDVKKIVDESEVDKKDITTLKKKKR